MAVHKTVLTLMDHTLALAILATALAMMDTPAMVLNLYFHGATACWDDLHYTDIDECHEGIHLCNQTCTNTNGSYTCQCQEGFRLDNNGVDCSGTFIRSR